MLYLSSKEMELAIIVIDKWTFEFHKYTNIYLNGPLIGLTWLWAPISTTLHDTASVC